jgi:hypothetical protein
MTSATEDFSRQAARSVFGLSPIADYNRLATLGSCSPFVSSSPVFSSITAAVGRLAGHLPVSRQR